MSPRNFSLAGKMAEPFLSMARASQVGQASTACPPSGSLQIPRHQEFWKCAVSPSFQRRAINRGNTCSIQHFRRFLPKDSKMLHLNTWRNPRVFCLLVGMHLALAAICTCMGPRGVKNDDYPDCSLSVVSARWRRWGYSRGAISARWQFDQALGMIRNSARLIEHYVTFKRLGRAEKATAPNAGNSFSGKF